MNRRTLKIIARITMTIDHIGMILFPHIDMFRIIGRISFPIFAYFVAEGCRYTKNRLRYVSLMAMCEAVCLVGYYIGKGYLYFSIMMTFIFSVVIITVYDKFAEAATHGGKAALVAGIGFMVFLYVMNTLTGILDIMYGFWGCMLPLFVYMRRDKLSGLVFFTGGLILQSIGSSSVQIYSLMAVPLLLFYDGKKMKTTKFEKYFYYVYYPLHIGFLYLLNEIIILF